MLFEISWPTTGDQDRMGAKVAAVLWFKQRNWPMVESFSDSSHLIECSSQREADDVGYAMSRRLKREVSITPWP